VTRYDRLVNETGAVRRLHQEDLCQALGQGASRKYEAEGGPSFANCYELVTKVSTNPLADGKSLLDWLVFNGAVGNCDGHAKNLSLLFQPSGGCALAPLYDLLSTRAYPQLSRSMAMTVGGVSDSGKLLQRHWLRLADDIGVGGRFFLDNARQLVEAVLQQLEPSSNSFREVYGAHPVLQLVVPVIRKQANMILRSLAA
jgi:serine/threonine-protein kinase HipA